MHTETPLKIKIPNSTKQKQKHAVCLLMATNTLLLKTISAIAKGQKHNIENTIWPQNISPTSPLSAQLIVAVSIQ